MLIQINKLLGYKVQSRSGENIGKVDDFIFDDHSWTVRYLVVNTGSWLMQRQVLVSPVTISNNDMNSDTVSVDMTREQIENSPPIQKHLPVSRQKELELARYYNWPMYWSDIPAALPEVVAPQPEFIDPSEMASDGKAIKGHDSQLRSIKKVTGYHIHATDGEIGKVNSFVVDSDNWIICYIVVDIGNIINHKLVILPPAWTIRINWNDDTIYIDVNTKSVAHSPNFNSEKPPDRSLEKNVYGHDKQK